MKNGELVKPDRMTGSPATKLLVAPRLKVTVAVGPVPELVQPVIEVALPTGARMLALGGRPGPELRSRQFVPFTLKSGE